MRRRTVVASLMTGLVACSLGAVAAPRIAARSAEGGMLRTFVREQIGRLHDFYLDLDVSKEQREKIRDVLVEHRSEISGVVQPVVEKRRALRDAVLAKNPSNDTIRAAANDLGKAIGDAAVLAAKVKPEIGKVFTSEQQDKIKDFHKQNDKAVDEFLEKIASPASGAHS